jgi:hypothetical protein
MIRTSNEIQNNPMKEKEGFVVTLSVSADAADERISTRDFRSFILLMATKREFRDPQESQARLKR